MQTEKVINMEVGVGRETDGQRGNEEFRVKVSK